MVSFHGLKKATVLLKHKTFLKAISADASGKT
jgi:hypothetical protein